MRSSELAISSRVRCRDVGACCGGGSELGSGGISERVSGAEEEDVVEVDGGRKSGVGVSGDAEVPGAVGRSELVELHSQPMVVL